MCCKYFLSTYSMIEIYYGNTFFFASVRKLFELPRDTQRKLRHFLGAAHSFFPSRDPICKKNKTFYSGLLSSPEKEIGDDVFI